MLLEEESGSGPYKAKGMGSTENVSQCDGGLTAKQYDTICFKRPETIKLLEGNFFLKIFIYLFFFYSYVHTMFGSFLPATSQKTS
jgi:hypothetical protein